MNVLLISQCDKRALTETRRILDQFAERRGDRTWQTAITQDGLDTLHRLLRKTARKNTAVACHWIRGLDHSEMLWVVGDRRRFNREGAVPTNTTNRNILRSENENDWHSADLIRLLVDLSGLLHDLGKAIVAFQRRLQSRSIERNLIRHEWVSLRMFEAFVGDDEDAAWLTRLVSPSRDDDRRWSESVHRDGVDDISPAPFRHLSRAPLARAIGWLVVTHHRLPDDPDRPSRSIMGIENLIFEVGPAWNEEAFRGARPEDLRPYWEFDGKLPITTDAWRQRASRIAARLLQACRRGPSLDPLADPFVMHLSRLALMLADHHYSRLEGDHPERVKVVPGNRLLANTCRNDGKPNQPLDEHLVGVARHGAEIARFLPRFETHLPHLGRVRKLRQRATDAPFQWQNRAADLARTMQVRSKERGGFFVNMASTGCGKTLANARVMDALADPQRGMRCAFAIGLRALTLQTGQAFRQMLGLTDSELAIRVGGTANRDLFEHYAKQAEATGSASSQDLLDEDAHVSFDGNIDQHPLLRRAVADRQVQNLLLAPVLVCTIDHLTPATESQRGGRQIAPMLRLLSGDLVLDEPDDFGLDDLPALTRLVHWAGLLGARVLLSSATLPPALVQGLFEAYRNGRQHFQRNRGARPGDSSPPAICCAWIDEFHQQQQDCADPVEFEQAHHTFALRRHGVLAEMAQRPRRRAELLNVPKLPKDLPALAEEFAPLVRDAALRLHRDHASLDPRSGKRVSFGLVRMANIEPLFEVALALFKLGAPSGSRIHLCVYHARHPLLVRSAIERELDTTLRRHQPDSVFKLSGVRERLDVSAETDHLFIVLGSPITEVGRDHDYDWAIVEPSSMRSLIQLAGRVRRHRPGEVASANILVFRTNLRYFRLPGQAVYCKPGFEGGEPFRLRKHDLKAILRAEEIARIDARPRIVEPDPLDATGHLVDLEHARLRSMMRPPSSDGNCPNASTWWHAAPQDALLTAFLPRSLPFRREDGRDVTVVLIPDDEGQTVSLYQLMKKQQDVYVECERLRACLPDSVVRGPGIEPWATGDYLALLHDLAEELDKPLTYCAKRFGSVDLPEDETKPKWRYHPALGFAKGG